MDQESSTSKGLVARGFWGPRQETPEQIADKLVTFLLALDDIVGENIQWSSHNLPGKPLTNPENARRVISDAFHKNTDAPHLGIAQAYDAQSTKLGGVSLSMIVGGYSDSPNVKNAFVMRWYGTESKSFAEPILRLIISVWKPDRADLPSRRDK